MKTIALFGAASRRTPKWVLSLAKDVGIVLGHYDHILIFGAGSTGVMGAAFEGYMLTSPKYKPFGSTTRSIRQIEAPCDGMHIINSDSMHDRMEIYRLAQALIVMPGGIGTMSELFFFMTEKKLKDWQGEIIVLDEGTQAPLLKKLIKDMEKHTYLRDSNKLVKFMDIKKLGEYLCHT